MVTETNGTKITAENETSGHRITRNESHFKSLPLTAQVPLLKEEGEDDYDISINTKPINVPPNNQRRAYHNETEDLQNFGENIEQTYK